MVSAIYVTKHDGTRQLFDKEKIIRTCLRMHAPEQAAKAIADRIEAKAYDGISTKQVLRMIFAELKKYKPEVAHQIDLRTSISLLRPKPDFENFVAMLLRAYGYSVQTNQIVYGKCVDHEIDAIATKGNDTVYVEVKHHYQPHTYTGLGVFLETQARFEDLRAVRSGRRINFTKVLIVCNTKISEHAERYAKCKGINYIAWKAPMGRGLEQLIESKKLYPITFLKALDRESEAMLGDAGIILLKQLVKADVNKLSKRTKLPKAKLTELRKKAEKILSGLKSGPDIEL